MASKKAPFARPKSGNPNIVEEYSPVIVMGMDNEDDPSSIQNNTSYREFDGVIRTAPSPSMPQPASSSSSSMPEEEQGQRFGADSGDPTYPKDGVFLYDWENGTPFDGFNFEALQRDLARRAKMATDPSVRFVAGIAQRIGVSVDRMLGNGTSTPLIKEGSTSVAELLAGSALPASMLIPMMADILNHVLTTPLVATGGVKQELGPRLFGGTPVHVKPESQTPAVKLEPKEDVESCINLLVSHREGIQLPCLIGSNGNNLFGFRGGGAATRVPVLGGGGGGGGGAQQQQLHRNPLLDELIHVFRQYDQEHASRERWAWSELPENSGIAIVRPEVMEAIEHCHNAIGALSGSHAAIKLWHLMTSSTVRGSFQGMIGALLNSAPGDLQYPSFQSVGGRNGAVTGTRISSGKWRHAATTSEYRQKLAWFKSVHYVPSSSWQELQARLPTARGRMQVARDTAYRTIEIAERDIRALWRHLGDDTDTYVILVANLADRRAALAAQFKESSAAEREWKRHRVEEYPQEDNGRINDAQKELADRKQQIKEIQAEMSVMLRGSESTTWRKLFGPSASYLVPFVGFDGSSSGQSYGPEPIPFMRERVVGLFSTGEYDAPTIKAASKSLIDELSVVLARAQMWKNTDTERASIYEAIASLGSMMTAFDALALEAKHSAEDARRAASFTEDDKVELIYTAPNIRPVTNYLDPASASGYYATI